MDFENFMAKKLGGKYKGPAPPSSPVRNSGSAPGPAPASSLDLTSGFSPLLYSTPNASSTSSRVDTGKKVDKLLRKQSLTRQQLNKIFPKRTDKILQLSKQQRETGKDLREKENVEGGEQVMTNERAESTVVKNGNTIKSNIGFTVYLKSTIILPVQIFKKKYGIYHISFSIFKCILILILG